MTTDQFNAIRREAEITSVEFADFVGACRRYMLRVETGREPVTPSLVRCLSAMIAEKGA